MKLTIILRWLNIKNVGQAFFSMLLFLSAQTALGQKTQTDYFSEGEKATEDSNYLLAINRFSYLVEHYKNDSLYPESCYNLGMLYAQIGKTKDALFIFKDFLRVHPENAALNDIYASFRHFAAVAISNLYNKKCMYDSSLAYLFKADTVYPFYHFCGNGRVAENISMAIAFADLYEKMNKPGLAEAALLKEVFPTGLADNDTVVAVLIKMYKSGGKQNKLKKDLEYAVKHIEIEKEYYKNNKDALYYYYYITFRKQKINTNFSTRYLSEGEKPSGDTITLYLKGTSFFKAVENL